MPCLLLQWIKKCKQLHKKINHSLNESRSVFCCSFRLSLTWTVKNNSCQMKNAFFTHESTHFLPQFVRTGHSGNRFGQLQLNLTKVKIISTFTSNLTRRIWSEVDDCFFGLHTCGRWESREKMLFGWRKSPGDFCEGRREEEFSKEFYSNGTVQIDLDVFIYSRFRWVSCSEKLIWPFSSLAFWEKSKPKKKPLLSSLFAKEIWICNGRTGPGLGPGIRFRWLFLLLLVHSASSSPQCVPK